MNYYKEFENFERVISAAREAYKGMEEMWYSYKELYKNGNSSDESFVDRVIIDAAEFAEVHGDKIEETFFGKRFGIIKQVIGNKHIHFWYHNDEYLCDSIWHFYNDLILIKETTE
jgi:hypothetical protein